MTRPSRYQQIKTLGLRNPKFITYQLTPTELNDAALSADKPTTTLAADDCFIVDEPTLEDQISQEDTKTIPPENFGWLYQQVKNHLSGRPIYVQDAYTQVDDEETPLSVRVITDTPAHSAYIQARLTPASAPQDGFNPALTVVFTPSVKAEPTMDGTHRAAFAMTHVSKRLIVVGGTDDCAALIDLVHRAAAYIQATQEYPDAAD